MSNNYLTGLAGVLASDVTRSLETDPVQEKINKLQERTQEKLNRLGNRSTQDTTIAGLYDADSPIWATADDRKPTARLTGDGYYVNAPELKVDGELTQAGINARIQADNYAMGVDAPNFQPGEGLDPQYYEQYTEAMNPAIVEQQKSGQYTIAPLDQQDSYGRELVTAQSTGMPMSQTDYLLEKGQGVKKPTEIRLPKEGSIGSISKKYESGGDVSTIAPDSGGTTSYGTYQMNSTGTMQDFLKSPEGQVFGKHLSKYEVGSPEFNATYQKIAKSNSSRLAEAQYKYIQRTHFEPIAQMAEKAGIDVQDPRVQEAIWSQSVQHSPEGNATILKNAINMVGVDAKPEELVQAMYISRNNYVQGLDTIDNTTKAQLANRYANELNDVLTASGKMSTKERLIAESEKRAADGGLENAAKAFAYTLGEGVANTVDLVPEIASYVYGNIIGDQKWSETKGLYDKEESAAYKEWLGYNDTIINKLGEEAVIAAKDAWEKGDYGGLLDVMGEALTTPELLTHSLGYVAGMILPGGAATKALQLTSKVNKTANAIKAADATGKLTKAQALAIAEKDAGAGYKILKTITNNVGFAGEAEQFSRDAEALYKETYNEEMPISQKLLIRPLGMLFAKTDALTAKAILLGKDPIAKAVPEMIKALPDAVKINFAGKMAVLAGSTAAKAAGAFGLEGSTEAIQTAMEKVAGKYKSGEVGVGDVLEQEKYEIAGSGILGGVGGDQMQLAGAAPQMVMDAPGQLKKGIELATENDIQKRQRLDREFASPKRKEALKAAIEGNPDGVIASASEIHGRMSDTLDSGAGQRYTYRAILNDALNAAAKIDDPKAAENVYKTIAALDANPNVEFKAKDILDREDSELVNKFLQLVNKPELSKTAKVVGVQAEDKMAEIAQIKAEADARKEAKSRTFGSDVIGDEQDINEIISKLADDYMKAKGDGKALESVNDEFARLGFIIKDGDGVKADPNRPGLKRYKEVLTDALIDSTMTKSGTTKQNLLLDKKLDQVWGVPTLGKLKKFAESRVAKLGEGNRQNNTMMKPLVKENSQMIELANELEAVIDMTTGITPENKIAYKELLDEVRTNAEAANAEVAKRQAVIQQLVEAGVSQEAADKVMYDVAKDGTVTLQVSTGKVEGKWSTKKIADVNEDGKLTLVDDYKELIKGTKVVDKSPATERIKEPTDSNIATKKSFEVKARPLTKSEVIKTIVDGKVETTKKGKIGDYVLTGPKGEEYIIDADKVKDRYNEKVNSDGTIILQTKPVSIKYSIADKDFTFTTSWGEQMIAEIGDALVYEDGKLSYRIEKEIFKDTYEPKVEISAKKEAKPQAQPEEDTGTVVEQPAVKRQAFSNRSIVDPTPSKEKNEEKAAIEAMEQAEVTARAKAQKPIKEKEAKPKAEKKQASKENPLQELREAIETANKELHEVITSVDDMNLKAAIRGYYRAELAKLNVESSRLRKLIKMLEANRKIMENDSVLERFTRVVQRILDILDTIAQKLVRHKAELDEINKTRTKLHNLYGRILSKIERMEQNYINANDVNIKVEKSPLGTVTKYEDSLYGPMAELGDKRTSAKPQIKKDGKLEAATTAMNKAVNRLGEERVQELRDSNTLGDKILADKIEQYGLASPIVQMLKQGNESVFGKMGKDMFEDANKLIDNLPKSFKEIFALNPESREALLDNITTMGKFVGGLPIGDIKLDKYYKLKPNETIDNFGMIVTPVTKGDKTYTVSVEMIELLGNVVKDDNKAVTGEFTYVDGKGKTRTIHTNILELDERVQTILKFYVAKLIADTQSMVGKLSTYDEAEIAKYLGIHDIEEQMELKLAAASGLVTAASVRTSIGNEVYNALGFKFTDNTPEVTKQTFIDQLGALVQAVAVDSGVLQAENRQFGNKNQRMLRVNFNKVNKILEVDKYGTAKLAKSINKLQYINEGKKRPLISKSKPKPTPNGKRKVMNTDVAVSDSDNEMMNSEEQKAYTLDTTKLKKYIEMDEDDFLISREYIDIETLPVGERLAQQGKNDQLIRDWDLLKTAYMAVGDNKFYFNWGQTVNGRFMILNDIQYQESKLHREFVHEVGAEATINWNDEATRVVLEGSILQGLDMDPDKLSVETARNKFAKLIKVGDKGIEIEPELDKNGKPNEYHQAIKDAYETLRDTGKINVQASAIVFSESEGHHGLTAIETLVDWNQAITSKKKSFKTKAQLESDAITSGMILTLLQIGTEKAIELLEKGGVYTKQQLADRTAYVKHWLGNNVTFSPGALIEAGKAHADAIEKGDKATDEQKAKLKGQETDITSNAVFKDLYSTIGVQMLEDVKRYKENLEKAKNSNNLTEEGALQLAIFKQLGELNLKNIRSIAKSPVMVYVYGASMNSIKTKLGYSLGVDTLSSAIKTASALYKQAEDNKPGYEQELLDKGFTIEEVKEESAKLNDTYGLSADELAKLNDANEFIDLFVPEKKYVTMTGAKADVHNMPKWKQVLHIEITAELAKKFKELIDKSFGKAIEGAFDKSFGFIDDNRNAMKALEVLQFEMYQIKLADKIEARLVGRKKSTGKASEISEQDLREINDELVAEGFGHTIVWETEGETKYQSMNKSKKVSSKLSTSAMVGNTRETVVVKEQKSTVNTGAMATIPIHAIDGNLLIRTLNAALKGKKTGGKNIYDAIATMLNAERIKANGTEYNTKVIEVGFSRSIIADQLKLVNNMLVKDPKLAKRVAKNMGLRPEGKSRADYIAEVTRLELGIGKMLEMLELAEVNNKQRVENSSQEFAVAHMYIMGQEVTTVPSSKTSRAKEIQEFAELKQLLKDVQEADRKQTKEEFGGRITNGVDYVFNLDDIAARETQIDSEANIATMKPFTEVDPVTGRVKGKVKVDNKKWGRLSSNDIVQIIGEYMPEYRNSQSYWYNEILNNVIKSGAGIITSMDLQGHGRTLVNGVWVKTDKGQIKVDKAETKVEEDTLSKEQITKLKEIFMNDKGELRSGIAKLAKELKLDMKDC